MLLRPAARSFELNPTWLRGGRAENFASFTRPPPVLCSQSHFGYFLGPIGDQVQYRGKLSIRTLAGRLGSFLMWTRHRTAWAASFLSSRITMQPSRPLQNRFQADAIGHRQYKS